MGCLPPTGAGFRKHPPNVVRKLPSCLTEPCRTVGGWSCGLPSGYVKIAIKKHYFQWTHPVVWGCLWWLSHVITFSCWEYDGVWVGIFFTASEAMNACARTGSWGRTLSMMRGLDERMDQSTLSTCQNAFAKILDWNRQKMIHLVVGYLGGDCYWYIMAS